MRKPDYGSSPATSEIFYTEEELAVLKAAEEYKKRMRRRFLTVTDTVKVMRSLGYRKDGGHVPAAESVSAQPKPKRVGIRWQEAAERMRQLRDQGEAWPGYQKLAERFGCSSGTLYRAVLEAEDLSEWVARQGRTGMVRQPISAGSRPPGDLWKELGPDKT
jgi:hypothetical protein